MKRIVVKPCSKTLDEIRSIVEPLIEARELFVLTYAVYGNQSDIVTDYLRDVCGYEEWEYVPCFDARKYTFTNDPFAAGLL